MARTRHPAILRRDRVGLSIIILAVWPLDRSSGALNLNSRCRCYAREQFLNERAACSATHARMHVPWQWHAWTGNSHEYKAGRLTFNLHSLAHSTLCCATLLCVFRTSNASQCGHLVHMGLGEAYGPGVPRDNAELRDAHDCILLPSQAEAISQARSTKSECLGRGQVCLPPLSGRASLCVGVRAASS